MLKFLLKGVRRLPIEFGDLEKPRTPNSFLMAPEGVCHKAVPDAGSPAFPVPVETLREVFKVVALSHPRVEALPENLPENFPESLPDNPPGEVPLQDEYVQYSKGIGFPDTITVRFLPAGEGGSTLAVFSRAHYGIRDFGVNRNRVLLWIEELRNRLKA
ncbi:DUF1499 domain-containing protein [Sneathiella chinensis]|uniref:DUF1499 domain-containing protein n=1 Tax=Sneathiella chinensis TaxID=349750 RepID=A0ABQ5U1V0_9PROT|nr:DUF1499 domain-containing protein [Sneathiella chinensis]GLQ05713.1 hypothetical protein GCM10007924_09340 [Sneathiella chinensis]